VGISAISQIFVFYLNRLWRALSIDAGNVMSEYFDQRCENSNINAEGAGLKPELK